MTLLEVIDASRMFLKDPLDSTRSFPDDSSSFFTDTEMTRWFNLEQRAVQNIQMQSFENWFVTATSIDIVGKQEAYAMPSDCLKIIRVENTRDTSAPVEVYPMSFNEKDSYPKGLPWNVTAVGDIQNYAIRGNYFVFRPRPASDQASGITVYYSQRVPERTSATSCSTIADEYHELLMWGMVKKGLMKQESTPEAMAIAIGEYNRLLGDLKSTAENRQVQRPRRIKRRRRY